MAKKERTRIPEALIIPIQDHTYECDNGHWITSPEELVRCPAYNRGQPCKAALRSNGARRTRKVRGKATTA